MFWYWQLFISKLICLVLYYVAMFISLRKCNWNETTLLIHIMPYYIDYNVKIVGWWLIGYSKYVFDAMPDRFTFLSLINTFIWEWNVKFYSLIILLV